MSKQNPQKESEGDVMGVTEPSDYFTRASLLLECEWCGKDGLHPSEVEAVKPENHAVMMCSECKPEPAEVDK